MPSTTAMGPIGERIRAAIKKSGSSQREIAAQIRIDETKLSKSLKGLRRFTADELLRLATATGVTVSWIMGEESSAVSAAIPRLEGAAERLPSADQKLGHRKIIETAWRLFAEQGFESVRIADIAAEAGVSSATVHYYFPTKQELFGAAMNYSVKLAYNRQVAWLSEVTDPAERLTRLLELQSPDGRTAELEWSIWVQMWNKITVDGRYDEAYVESYRRWVATVRSTIEDGQRQGLFRAGDPDSMSLELTSLMDGYGIKVLTRVIDKPAMARGLRDYLRRCIALDGSRADSRWAAESR
ncbi:MULTISPECIES: TetR family transcriptional regulator C-terminal domain-containing protein [unclassified Arthrobacter]|uniref:TetR family transcriptional regulator C-terminal domain-containing protein n=1 Tax=unclassified Arthrobacter TaxID=235627 RepID=UPI00215727A5|nr:MULTISPECIES: TetR family transcriptional regulator C-terminal domain-containing protein [unclassified Arthrobacter]